MDIYEILNQVWQQNAGYKQNWGKSIGNQYGEKVIDLINAKIYANNKPIVINKCGSGNFPTLVIEGDANFNSIGFDNFSISSNENGSLLFISNNDEHEVVLRLDPPKELLESRDSNACRIATTADLSSLADLDFNEDLLKDASKKLNEIKYILDL